MAKKKAKYPAGTVLVCDAGHTLPPLALPAEEAWCGKCGRAASKKTRMKERVA